MNKRVRGLLLVALGLTLILAAVCLHILHERQDMLAGQNAAILSETLIHEIQYSPPEASQGEGEDPSGDAMPSRTLAGYDLIGMIRIPSVGMELPVLDRWSDDLLNVAPCRYSGSLKNGNLILLGHNYKSHFRPLWQVNVGDSVEFTDISGTTCRYVVAEVDIISGTEYSRLASEYPLTLFTCTGDSRHRVVVRCEQ